METWRTEVPVAVILNCEYLTYKEWKQSPPGIFTGSSPACEYLTYKEWKLYVGGEIGVVCETVSTLPIRNGNSFDSKMLS